MHFFCFLEHCRVQIYNEAIQLAPPPNILRSNPWFELIEKPMWPVWSVTIKNRICKKCHLAIMNCFQKLGISNNTKNIDYELFTNLRINVILCFDTRSSCYLNMKTSEYVAYVHTYILAKKSKSKYIQLITADKSTV